MRDRATGDPFERYDGEYDNLTNASEVGHQSCISIRRKMIRHIRQLQAEITRLKKENNEYEWALDWFLKKYPVEYAIMNAELSLES